MATELDYMEYANDGAAQAAYVNTVTAKNVKELTFVGGTANNSNYHIRSRVLAIGITDSLVSTSIRVQFQTSETEPVTIDLAYIGEEDATDFNMKSSPAKVQITFDSGSASKTIPAGTAYWSDWITFVCDGTKDLLVSVDLGLAVKNAYMAGQNVYGKRWAATNGAADDIAPGGGTDYVSLFTKAFEVKPVTQCFSESSIKEQGSYSLKVVATQTDSLNDTLTRTI